jgi:GT2 family glycosyltransferase
VLSVVICSIDAAKFAAVTANFRERLAGQPHELIGIHDARSLAEGYNRGLRQARGDVVVFSHDDVAIVSPDLAGALARALAQLDVVGVVGTTQVINAYWPAAGNPHLRGWLSVPAADGRCFVNVYGVDGAISTGVQGLDGFLFAARREVATAVAFDAATFDGWHGYDIDFSFSAHRAGYRIGTTAEIAVVHASIGTYDDAWKRFADRFQHKHRAALPARITMAPWKAARIEVPSRSIIAAQFPVARLMEISAPLLAAG